MWKSLVGFLALLLCSEQASSVNNANDKKAAVSEIQKANSKDPEILEAATSGNGKYDDYFATIRHSRKRRNFQEAAIDPDKPINHNMNVYGTIRKIDPFTGISAPICGGILLASRVILTSSLCARPDGNNRFPLLQFSRTGNLYGAQILDYNPNFPFALLLLHAPVFPLPDVFAFPSWTGEWQTTDINWLILPETVLKHPYRIASYYAAAEGLGDETPKAANIDDALTTCHFKDKADMVALLCTGTAKASLPLFIQEGDAFFRQITQKPTRAVAVPALVMRDESFAKCDGYKSHKELPFLLKRKAPVATQGTYVCGPRFTFQHVHALMQAADQARHPFADKDVIPNGRIFGTMNINGVARMARPLGSNVMNVLMNIIGTTDIIAIQETARVNPLDAAVTRYGYAKATLPPGTTSTSKTTFYYKSAEIQQEECYEVSKNNKAYGLYCRFRYKQRGGQSYQCIHFYTVHLTEGVPATRHKEIKDLKDRIDLLNPALNCKSLIIGGDFNIGAPQLSIPNTKDDIDYTITTLSNMRFHDTGGTTEKDGKNNKESHYDHLLVSESTRLLHQYYPLTPPGKRSEVVYNLYVPFSSTLRLTDPRVRSYDLSDHLPIRFRDPHTFAFIGTWNLHKLQPDSTNKAERNEYKNRVEYERMFRQFHILALQELSATAPGKPVMATTLYGKALATSKRSDAKELGFAYDANALTAIHCSELNVTDPPGTAQPKTYRPMYGCTFETKTTQPQRVTVFSVHVLNKHAKIETSKLYRKHVYDYARVRSQLLLGNVFLVGDFNADKPAGSIACPHTYGLPGWEHTLITSKNIRDYVWYTGNTEPGIPGCEVLNPELMRDGANQNIIDDSPTARPGMGMPVFASWKEISDHLPMMVQFSNQ